MTGQVSDVTLPVAEIEFTRRLEAWYERQGVSRSETLFGHWVQSDAAGTYRAGQRAARELGQALEIRGCHLLDVGCGFGGALVALCEAGGRCTGLEYDSSRLSMSRERLGLHGLGANLVRGDGFSMPFPDGSFDAVLCMEVLEHVPRRPAIVREMARVLRPGGLLYLSFPNLLSWSNFLSDPHYQLAGVVALPLPIARWYTKKRRGRNYDVEILPFAPWVARMCADNGVPMYSLNASERVLLERIANPDSIGRPLARRLFRAIRQLGLDGLARVVVRGRAAMGATTTLMGTKAGPAA